MTFEADLERGIEAEKIVLSQVQKRYPCACLVNAFKGYDIWVPEKSIGIEVKYDPASNETGNYLLEYEMNNKPSGLMTTEAKVWVLFDGSVLYYFKPLEIIRCIFDDKLHHVVIRGPGDHADKRCFLVKKEKLQRYAFREEAITTGGSSHD